MGLEPVYWHWLIFGLALIAIEMFTLSFMALWFGAGAVLVGALMLFFPGITFFWQVFIWIVASATCTFAWFKYFRPLSVDRTKAGLSREAIIGQTGQVIRPPQGDQRGELRFSVPILGSEEWAILCEEALDIGQRVVVVDILGNALVVKKA